MKKILIFGSGSIGNHMAYASRRLKYDVHITDTNPLALKRMKSKIYPRRYKKWDKNIKILNYKDVFNSSSKFDLVIIGTPPKTHISLYRKCLKGIKYKKLLIEKPLTNYTNNQFFNFAKTVNKNNIFCGYNHSVSKSFLFFYKELIKIKNLNQINVDWRENWDGILNAHFWLKNEFGSYLGNLNDGGGALQEHSHGLHLLILILKTKNINLKNIKFQTNKIYNKNLYDLYFSLTGIKKGIFFNYQTDLVSKPSTKKIEVSDGSNCLKLIFNYDLNKDVVIKYKNNNQMYKKYFKKTRSSEFENEIKYLIQYKSKKETNLSVKHAIDVMHVIRKSLNEK